MNQDTIIIMVDSLLQAIGDQNITSKTLFRFDLLMAL